MIALRKIKLFQASGPAASLGHVYGRGPNGLSCLPSSCARNALCSMFAMAGRLGRVRAFGRSLHERGDEALTHAEIDQLDVGAHRELGFDLAVIVGHGLGAEVEGGRDFVG